MSDDPPCDKDEWPLPPDEGKRKPKWIPRETYRQEGAVRFVKHAVKQPHELFAFDRNKRDRKSHLWESKRGIRRGTLDTLLRWPGVPLWFDFKVGNNKPDDDQQHMMRRLELFGDRTAWGVTIWALWAFYKECGVPMEANAEYQAMHLDGLVDSRIAKEELKQSGGVPVKKARPRKTPPRYLAGKRLAARIYAK